MTKNLILGLGNEFQRDDGIGSRIANDLKFKFPDVTIKTFITGSLDLLLEISGFDSVYIIDGTVDKNKAIGEVSFGSFEHNQPTLHLENFHDVGLKEAIQFGHAIRVKIPAKIIIISVVISEILVFGRTLSEPLDNKYDTIVNQIAKMIDISIINEKSFNDL